MKVFGLTGGLIVLFIGVTAIAVWVLMMKYWLPLLERLFKWFEK